MSAEIDELRTNISDTKNDLSRKRATLDFLESLVDSDETTKFLQKSNKWKAGEEKIPLAEAVGADEKFLVAVDAALGEAGRYFIVKDRDEALSGIELLKSANKGKTAFISTSDIPAIEPPQRNGSVEGEFGWVSELVRVEDNIRNALRALTGGMMIIDSRENAVKAVDSGSAEAAVTLDGEIIRRGGIIKGGAGARKESITIGKRERIKQINSEIKEISAKLSELESSFHSLKDKHDSIDLKTLNDAVRAAENSKNHNENKISQLKYRKEILENNLSHVKENIEEYREELNRIGGGSGFAERIESLEKELAAAKDNHREKENELDEAEDSLHETEEELKDKEKELVRSSSAIETMQRDIRTYEQRLSGLQRNIKEKNDDIQFSEKLANEVTSKIQAADKELDKLEVDENEAGNKREYLNSKVESIDEQISQQSESIKKLRSRLDKLNDDIYEKELVIGQIDSRRSNVEVKAEENYNVILKDDDFAPDKEFDLAESKITTKELNEKLQKIGPINHMAVVDYEKESERLRFYKKQVEDLTESEKTLRETIKEINTTAEKKFIETFDKIRANFKMLFKKLFGEEGECEISLEEGNPLDSDISIMAKPPGKRPYSIEGISSGEKALTAIALLFAIYLVKPSPFCILDEVDAPLDDNNIGRFLKMIRDFSRDTQFLVVTHNKITMEAADTLYGITMPEKGVSKVVSVKLAQTLAS